MMTKIMAIAGEQHRDNAADGIYNAFVIHTRIGIVGAVSVGPGLVLLCPVTHLIALQTQRPPIT